MSELQEATKEFLIESHENLDDLDTALVGLEKLNAPKEALSRIFRTLHTIKGSCSFLGFPNMEAIAHAGETLLGKLRDGQLVLNPAITNALLRMVDAIRRTLTGIEELGSDDVADETELIGLLNQLAKDDPHSKTITTQMPSADPRAAVSDQSFEIGPDVEIATAKTIAPTARPVVPRPAASDQSFEIGPDVDNASAKTIAPTARTVDPRPTVSSQSFEIWPDAELSPASATGTESVAAEGSAVYDASVRIHVDLLDKLMAIAGEIVLARNHILQFSQRNGDQSFQNTCRQLNLSTTELQEHVMKTRLQPIGNVWNRLPRLVRDSAQTCGKRVRLEMEGSETELDKTLLEAIRDPLTHLVRNSIDHGIESPEQRRAAGKTEEGFVRLRAYHEGGQVNIEISDDGGGIDPARVKNRAIEQNLVTVEQAGKMSSQSVLGLIFLPGFSTAAAVTTLSGRGVGMDVVKTNIEKIGGSVDVQSALGRGTTVRIRIPLTLAIIKVLVATSGGNRYAIPQVSIVELVRLEGEKARKSIQRLHDELVYRYRGRLLPLVSLNQMLKLDEMEAGDDGSISIVVLQAAEQQFGLIVDEINDSQEIVVKPLWKHLKNLACFAGATVMGDGRVALILDVFGLAQRAGAITNLQSNVLREAESDDVRPVERPNLLLVEGRDRGRLAIPLNNVARLEEFPRGQIEHVADRRVVQYCGQILPLLELDAALGTKPSATADDNETVQVVVYTRPDRTVGLVVNRIVDIAADDGDVRGSSSRHGVKSTAVIHGHVTEMLDIDALIGSGLEL